MIQWSLSSIHIFLISQVHKFKVRYSSKHGIAFQYENLELSIELCKWNVVFQPVLGGHLILKIITNSGYLVQKLRMKEPALGIWKISMKQLSVLGMWKKPG
jgi:hypothetical protein